MITQLIEKKNFTDIEKDIADYILKEGEKICSLSIQDFSNLCYTSPSTMMRFCKKLGTTGFSDF